MFVMGRKFPVFSDNISLIHHFLYFSFLIASFTASIAIITAICSVRFRRKSSPPPTPPPTVDVDPLNKSKDLNPSSSSPQPITTETISNSENVASIEKSENTITTETENNEEVQIKELPLPPAMLVPKEPSLLCSNNNFKKVASERRASFSLSLKMPRSLSVARNWDHKEDKNKWKVKTEDSVLFGKKTEESVWMKTIILGEKCVPDEEDPVIYEGKGKKISAYHPKSYSTISRQTSFLDADVFSVSQREDDRVNNI